MYCKNCFFLATITSSASSDDIVALWCRAWRHDFRQRNAWRWQSNIQPTFHTVTNCVS